MKNKVYFLCIVFMMTMLFSQGFNMDLFSGEGAQPYSYYADEINFKTLSPAEAEEDITEESTIGRVAFLELKGNAWIHLEDDDVTIEAQTIIYSREEGTVVATYQVSIIQKDSDNPDIITLKANCEKATFYIADNRLVLEDNPIIVMGDNSIRGERITFYEDEAGNQYMNIHGGPNQRASGSYKPERRQNIEADTEPENQLLPEREEENIRE